MVCETYRKKREKEWIKRRKNGERKDKTLWHYSINIIRNRKNWNEFDKKLERRKDWTNNSCNIITNSHSSRKRWKNKKVSLRTWNEVGSDALWLCLFLLSYLYCNSLINHPFFTASWIIIWINDWDCWSTTRTSKTRSTNCRTLTKLT
jgi:hypothetical protein